MASMALLPTTSFGQEESDSSTTELSPLSVTGTKAEPSSLSSGLKTSLPIDSLPKSVSVMNAEQIKAQGLKSVGDIIDYTPGVNNSQGEGHRDAAVIRGVRTTQDFYRDGVRDGVSTIVRSTILSKSKSSAVQTLFFRGSEVATD